jgi:SAM-dependent methyltransferase
MAMTDFAQFDRRHYPVVSPRDGYRAWLPTYEDTVEDPMALALLDRIQSVDWSRTRRAADLGCGTGRTARWLRQRAVAVIDGVDVTPEMIDAASARGDHTSLAIRDARHTGLPGASYDLVVSSLVDEHLPELVELYVEVRRLLRPAGAFVLVGYHPYFIMASGMPTHFDDDERGSVAIETHVHLPSSHFGAAREVGLVAHEMLEGVIDDEWIALKPNWGRYRGWPISFAFVWRMTT